MKILGIIPARYASTRFPGKPLQMIAGKPLLQWVCEVAQKSKILSDVYVATDHPAIAELCQKINIKYLMTSSEAPTGTDRIYQACTQLKEKGLHFEAVINIQGDEPLLPVEYIDQLGQAFQHDSHLQMATLAHPLSHEDLDNKNAVKVLVNQNQMAIYFSRFPIPFSRHKNDEPVIQAHYVQKHVGLYGYSVDFLQRFCQHPQSLIEKHESLEQLRALDMGTQIKVISVPQATFGVDTPEDLKKIEAQLRVRLNEK